MVIFLPHILLSNSYTNKFKEKEMLRGWINGGKAVTEINNKTDTVDEEIRT